MTWHEANQRYLMAALAEMRQSLEPLLGSGHGAPAGGMSPRQVMEETAAVMAAPPALETLCNLFHLSSFERTVLLACAGVELDSDFAALVSPGRDGPGKTVLTLSIMLGCFPDAHWSAISPTAPLRYRHLVELGSGPSLVTSPIRIAERVLHYLTGVHTLDEGLLGILQPVEPSTDLVPSHRSLAERMAAVWSDPQAGNPLPVVQMTGRDRLSAWDIAASACRALGLRLYALSSDAVPTETRDLTTLMRLWEREAALSGSALLLDCFNLDPSSDAAREHAVTRSIEGSDGPLVLCSRDRWPTLRRPAVTIEVGKPSLDEQWGLWMGNLSQAGVGVNGQVDKLVSQFDMDASAIRAISTDALGCLRNAEASAGDVGAAVWDACSVHGRQRLDALAQRIEPVAFWDDLVLPNAQVCTLKEIALQVRHRRKVYQEWGFASKSARGLGISVLFAGPSGTGKTMAAEVLASELHLNLYRIDLSSVVSKYIGETEKNLRRVFDAAEDGGTTLLFDEADALFGKRSEVKDSHDRYANIEVSYLLQRMEAYQGLAILTTNMKSALDSSFLRRIRFVVQFPFPDASQRAEIWKRVFPKATPTHGLDIAALARLNVSGGNIRNIAMNAAFLSADAGEPVTMRHILSAARSEYAKLEKTMTDAEVRGWV
jgi:hypothetical protein